MWEQQTEKGEQDSRGENNGHGVVHDTLSKQESVEVHIHVELSEDGQHRHCSHRHTERQMDTGLHREAEKGKDRQTNRERERNRHVGNRKRIG